MAAPVSIGRQPLFPSFRPGEGAEVLGGAPKTAGWVNAPTQDTLRLDSTTYSYDGLGQLWKQVSPDTGTTTFTYDAYGRLTDTTRNSGNHIAYAYDPLNRVMSVAATNTSGTVTRSFTWDACPNGKGRLCSAVHVNDDTVSYSYTPQGQIAQRNFSFVAGVAYSLNYSYDNMGNLASVTYPDGNQALYDYSHGVATDVRLQIGSVSSYAATGGRATGLDGWLAPTARQRRCYSILRIGREALVRAWPMERTCHWLQRLRELPPNVLRQTAVLARDSWETSVTEVIKPISNIDPLGLCTPTRQGGRRR